MSLLNLKFTPGAPAQLLPGMAVRVPGANPGETCMVLVGTFTSVADKKFVMENAIGYAQAIEGYVLDWLNNMGVPAKAVV